MLPIKKWIAGVAAVAALAFGAAAIADAAGSGGRTAATPATTTTAPAGAPGQPPFPAHGTAAHEDAEKAVTGTDAAKAQTAAVQSLGGGTAGAVTTDYQGSGYEVAVTTSDGSSVEVHLDSSFNVQQGPGGAGGPGAPGTHPSA